MCLSVTSEDSGKEQGQGTPSGCLLSLGFWSAQVDGARACSQNKLESPLLPVRGLGPEIQERALNHHDTSCRKSQPPLVIQA